MAHSKESKEIKDIKDDEDKKSANPTKLATLMSKKEELMLAKEKI